jgi:hypothetical protein
MGSSRQFVAAALAWLAGDGAADLRFFFRHLSDRQQPPIGLRADESVDNRQQNLTSVDFRISHRGAESRFREYACSWLSHDPSR